jgi:hypothetical protein
MSPVRIRLLRYNLEWERVMLEPPAAIRFRLAIAFFGLSRAATEPPPF